MRILGRQITLAAAACALGSSASLAAPAPAPAAPPAATAVSVHGIDLEHATILDLQQAMDRGRLSSVELTAFYLARIVQLNPSLHAVIVTSPSALLEALFSDVRRQLHQRRGPLDGIPVLLKDNVDTANMGATAGSEALSRARQHDAFIVGKLRDAGAVVLGKTNLSEWANFRSSLSSSGWSGVGGQTANPYVLDRNPCGSSSGSGAGIAANLAVVAIGTETDGSVVCPSGANGIVGIKPTLGLVSRSGIVPISEQQDTAGAMARNVTDAAVLLSVVSGVDPADGATAASAGHRAPDYTKFLDPHALRGKRIGVWKNATGGEPATDAVFAQFIANLQAAGATPVEVDLPFQDVVNDNEFPALLTEFKHDIKAYLDGTAGRHPADLGGLIAFNNAHADTELQFFDQDIFDLAQATTGDLNDPTYKMQRQLATDAARHSIDDTLAQLHLDAIAAATNSPAWVTTLGEGDAFVFGSSGPAAVAGYPSVVVPAGFVGPLPVGVSLIGGQWQEPQLIAFAYAYEQATHARRAPTFLPTFAEPAVKPAAASASAAGHAMTRLPRVW
ncbi:MAG TPA: amidase [Kofleriaceae bacterium]|nr:amidase [Kofleriaceae bacterium]